MLCPWRLPTWKTRASSSNLQAACPLRVALEEMGWPQPATPVRTDNLVSKGIVTGEVKQRRSRAIDMRFCWVRDRVEQGQHRIHWRPGKTNLADCFTKHHSPKHHQTVRPIYLHEEEDNPHQESVRGCVDPASRPGSTEAHDEEHSGTWNQRSVLQWLSPQRMTDKFPAWVSPAS